MDGPRFDSFARVWAGIPRRSAIRAVLAAALAGLPTLSGARPAAARCLPFRKPCRFGRQCCSGSCRGKRGKKTCRRVFSQGTCTIERNACLQGVAAACGAPGSSCFCFITPQGTSFCGRGNTVNSCEQCAQQFPGRLCFPQSGPQCGPFGCLEPCPS